ncbi:MAG: aldehyde ferredoxin oxidoreductase family protein [Nanopusillaceae archaeon]
MFGYNGKILRINLSSQKISIENLDNNTFKFWIGGRGLGVYYFIKEVDPKVNPLSEKNKIIFLNGPLTGVAGAPLPGRAIVVSKSPLNYRLSWSSAGGKFGTYLKFAGYDGIIIEGKSESPIYISIIENKVEIKDASEIWGKTVFQTYDYLYELCRKEYNIPDVSIACIGPAGENLVKYANIMCEKYHAFGRMGFGSILGYKKVKAIVVYGKNRPKIFKEDLFREISLKIIKKLKDNELLSDLSKSGTLGMLISRIGSHGAIPAYNFSEYIKIDTAKIKEEFIKRIDNQKSVKEICWGCQIGCHKYVKSIKEKFSYEGGNPEYWGGFVSLGSSLGITDIDIIIYLKGLCDELGLDAISTGHTISNFLEICEKTKLYNFKFGDVEQIIQFIKNIAFRKDIGDILAEGSDYLGKKYNYPVTTSKGLEIGLCHPDKAYGYNLALTTSNRGDHNQTMLRDEILLNKLDPKSKYNKVDYVIYMQNLFAILDSLVICAFSSYALDFKDISELLNSVTGLEFSEEELIEIGNRIYSAERYFNVLSLDFEKDKLPERFKLEIKDLLEDYYKKRGWVNGKPTEETLKKLKII